jgi:hypothetical protein
MYQKNMQREGRRRQPREAPVEKVEGYGETNNMNDGNDTNVAVQRCPERV